MASALATKKSQRNRDDLDGLRALAFLAVYIHHTGIALSGGYVGVDVFFVLSGYLITSQLRRHPFFTVGDAFSFMYRRMRRLLPHLSTALLIATVACCGMLPPTDLMHAAKASLASIMMLSNLYYSRQAGYFDPSSAGNPFLHTWSLSLELQFYAVFAACALILRHSSKQLCRGILLTSVFLSCAYAVHATHAEPILAFYLPLPRIWEFALGGACTWIAIGRDTAFNRMHYALVLLALGGLCMICHYYSTSTVFPGLSALPPCVCAAVLICFGDLQSVPLRNPLSNKYLVFLGRHSYGMYLWHWPVLTVGTLLLGRLLTIAEAVVVYMGVAILSSVITKLIEGPIRKQQLLSSPFAFCAALLLVTLVLGTLVFFGNSTNGYAWRHNSESITISRDRALNRKYVVESRDVKTFDSVPRFGSGPVGTQIVLWGDSHAMALLPALERVCSSSSRSVVPLTASSTPPLLSIKASARGVDTVTLNTHNARVAAYIAAHPGTDVVLAAWWDKYLFIEKPDVRLKDTVEFLLSHHKHVTVVIDPPTFDVDIAQCLEMRALLGVSSGVKPLSLREWYERSYFFSAIDALRDLDGVTIVSPAAAIAKNSDTFTVRQQGHSAYRDSNHLSVFGSQLAANAFIHLGR